MSQLMVQQQTKTRHSIRICLFCGKKLVRKTYKDGRLERPSHFLKRNLCDYKCAGKHRTKNRTCLLKCLCCRKQFTSPVSEFKRTGRPFCSTTCRDRSQMSERVTKNCLFCFKAFTVPAWQSKNAPTKFCSQKCYWGYATGTQNHRWAGGRQHVSRKSQNKRRLKIKQSTEHFSADEWESVKKEYNYSCLACQKGEPDIKLVADHVKPIAKGGDNSIQNIQPLCVSCNCKKHTKHIDYRML